jgi:multiple sugar transport system permease protein
MSTITALATRGERLREISPRVWLFFILAIIIGLAMGLPFVWLVRSSLMEFGQIFLYPIQWVPDPFAFSNFADAMNSVPFVTYFLNTMIILVPSVIGTVISCALTAYGFSRLEWKGRDLVFNILLSAFMLPFVTTLIPTFLFWSSLDQVNTFTPLVLPHWFGADIFFVFMLRQFFLSLPRELDEAAILDGANPLRVFWDIVLPLSRPALVTVAILASLDSWNAYLEPLIYLNDGDKYTLPLGLQAFTGLYTSQWHLLMAAAVIVTLPVVIMFFFAQRYFVEGITMTGIKS